MLCLQGLKVDVLKVDSMQKLGPQEDLERFVR